MDKPVLNLDQLVVESFTTADASQVISPGIIDTGCVSGCVSGCGGFGDIGGGC